MVEVRKSWLLLIALAVVGCLRVSCAGAATSYSELTKILRTECAARPDVLHLYGIGAAAASGRPIWMVRITAAGEKADLTKTPRFLIVCRQHGDEPVSTEAAIQLVRQAAEDSQVRLFKQFGATTLFIVPMANPDGADRLQRTNGVGVDLNRDWGKFTQPETRAIFIAYKQIKPQMVVDMHSWTASDSFQSNSVEACHPFGPISSPVEVKALELQRGLIKSLQTTFKQSAIPVYYSPTDSFSLCHRFFAEQEGVVSLLVETAPCDNTEPQMKPRIAFDVAAMDNLLASMQQTPRSWLAVARLEQSQVAPATLYTTSFASLVPSFRPARISTKTTMSSRHAQLSSKMLLWTLGAYVLACLGMLRAVGPNALMAFRRLLRKLPAERENKAEGRVYVSVRQKMFPANHAWTAVAERNESWLGIGEMFETDEEAEDMFERAA